MSFKMLTKTVCILLNVIAIHQAYCANEHTAFWLDASMNDYLSEDKLWSYSGEAQVRFIDEKNIYQLFFLQAKLGHQIAQDFSATIGYQWAANDPIEDNPSTNMIFEELYWWPKMHDNVVVRTRSRFEQINRQHEGEWGNVMRQRLSFYLPNMLSDYVTPLIYDEIFVKLNNPEWDAETDTLSQNWLFLGLDIYTSKTWFITTGYLQRYIFKNNGDELDNVIYLGFNYNPAMLPDYVYIK